MSESECGCSEDTVHFGLKAVGSSRR
eukprot:COSAG03_NODE_27491_length_253_cov_0.512987_1_plen_25_part_10